jgi:pimeloyl-ACP methyl ester carboxylesterase
MLATYSGIDLLHHAPVNAAAPRPRVRRVRSLGILQPMLVLNGAQDSAQRRNIGQKLAAHVPGARHVIIEGAGHLACLDDPATYARALGDFVCGYSEPF